MPKVQYATSDELQELRAELKSLTEKVQSTSTAQAKSKDSEAKLRGELQEVAESVTTTAAALQASAERVAADSKEYADLCTAKISEELSKAESRFNEKITSTEQDVEAKLASVDAELRQALVSEVKMICERVDQEIQALRQEITQTQEARLLEVAEELQSQRQRLDSSFEEARRDAAAKAAEAGEAAQAELKKAMGEQASADARREEQSQRAQAELNTSITRIMEQLQEAGEESAKAVQTTREAASADLSQHVQLAEGRLSVLEREGKRFREAVAEVENLPTREVHWVIRDASKKLKTRSDKAGIHTSWFSPKFDAAGAHGLQLELQLFRPADPPVADEGTGDCAVYLWACRGMSLVYKLGVGSKTAVLERVFNGRVPFGTKRLCFIKDQVNQEDDTLRISVEILESVREVELPILPPSARPGEVDEGTADDNTRSPEGLVVFKRHINNRMLEQVNGHVELINSRMVRHIDWRLEKAALLRKCFPQGQAMCSSPFDAAGVRGLQLVFYPSGYSGATDGYCSLFLFGPAGATLKCCLWAGKHRRDASHSFKEPGSFGRTNFCMFESAVDESTDSIYIGLDIEEAHQELRATVAHPTAQPGERRTQAQLDGILPAAVESVVKLQRSPGKIPAGLEDRRVLPSLWTPTPQGQSSAAPESMFSFEELKARSSGKRANIMSAMGHWAARDSLTPSKSMPMLTQGDELSRPQELSHKKALGGVGRAVALGGRA